MSLEKGFSLIELLIVVAIMLIVAAIAIPSLVRSRMAANEASAAASLKQIGVANATYSAFYGVGYAGALAKMGPPSGACAKAGPNCADLLDIILSGINPPTPTPMKSGYLFEYFVPDANPGPGNPNTTYSVVAVPITPGSTGQSTFCFDNALSIYKDTSGIITDGDPTGCPPVWPVGGTVNPL
ncbi:MAG: type II secretion system protein [Acidobacteria bacterium]|nr:type II secretion system protein [Acidobacteriota bacterium]